MSSDPQLERAEARAHAARQRLIGTLSSLQRRLSPGALLDDALGEISERTDQAIDRAVAHARRHPGQIALAGLVIGLAVLPRSALALFSRPFRRNGATGKACNRLSNRNDEKAWPPAPSAEET